MGFCCRASVFRQARHRPLLVMLVTAPRCSERMEGRPHPHRANKSHMMIVTVCVESSVYSVKVTGSSPLRGEGAGEGGLGAKSARHLARCKCLWAREGGLPRMPLSHHQQRALIRIQTGRGSNKKEMREATRFPTLASFRSSSPRS